MKLDFRLQLAAALVSLVILWGCAAAPKHPAPASSDSKTSGSAEQASSSPPPPPPPPAEQPPVELDGSVSRPAPKSTGPKGEGSRAAPGATYSVVRVFYATDRSATGAVIPAKFYGGGRQVDESLHLGTVDVSIPKDHRIGTIDRPSIMHFEFKEDPAKHIVLLGVTEKSEQEFYAELASRVQSSPGKEAFVFVHGFDNKFEQAAWRTAQLFYDLQFKGAPIMYSWPSQGKLTAYTADEASSEWSTAHLQKFLEQVAAHSHATTVHLIAHSMGNRVLTAALAGIAAQRGAALPMFKQVFLAAPDIDVGLFRQLAATFPSAATHVTLYASSKDEAIVASEKIHRFDRVGDSTHICVVPNIDTVDASAVDTGLIGHAYYGDNRSIISDIFAVMNSGTPPGQRFGMHEKTYQQATYWAFVP